MSEEHKRMVSHTVEGDSATQIDYDKKQYGSLKEGERIKIEASAHSRSTKQSRKVEKNAFNEGLKALQTDKKKKLDQSDADSSIAGGRSAGGSADFNDSSNEMSFEDKQSISSRMLALHQKQ